MAKIERCRWQGVGISGSFFVVNHDCANRRRSEACHSKEQWNQKLRTMVTKDTKTPKHLTTRFIGYNDIEC